MQLCVAVKCGKLSSVSQRLILCLSNDGVTIFIDVNIVVALLPRVGGSWYMVALTIIFVVVTLIRLARVVLNVVKYLYIRGFYVNALKINTVSYAPAELCMFLKRNYTF